MSYWRLLIRRYGSRPLDTVGVCECNKAIAGAICRAKERRPRRPVDLV